MIHASLEAPSEPSRSVPVDEFDVQHDRDDRDTGVPVRVEPRAPSRSMPAAVPCDPSTDEPVEPPAEGSGVIPVQPPGEALAASFAALSDGELHATVRRLTARSNITLADLLVHLGEVESRGVHRERACASLYTYCVYELRMSEDVAYRRAKAARVVRQHPDLRDVLARGELHLTGLLMIAPYLGGERHAEVLERARFRT